MGKAGRCRLMPEKLLRIYHIMSKYKNRTFLARDFFEGGSNRRHRVYMDVLERMNVIEAVPYVYRTCRGYTVNHTVRGYRFKSKGGAKNG